MSNNKQSILLIDDDRTLTEVLTVNLQSQDYRVEVAQDGAEALKKFRDEPDLALLDLTLPDMDGLEICRQIRNDKQLNHIPIIILSGRDETTDKVEGLYVGADDYITKPFETTELLARINSVLRRTLFNQKAKEDMAEVVNELKKIIQHELITPFFQPVFYVDTLEPIGLEVFSRPTTNSTLSSPVLLFKAALTLGMYSELETLCWKKAIAIWKQSINKGKLFLNCTPKFIEGNQLDRMFFSHQGVSPQDVMLEITECTSIEDSSVLLEKLNDFKKLGIKITFEDFGRGSTNLDALDKVAPDFIKIDESLIHRIYCDSLKQNVVKSLIDLCKEKKIETIAEGIEETDEFNFVSDLGINAVQGNLFARPMQEINIDLFEKMIKRDEKKEDQKTI